MSNPKQGRNMRQKNFYITAELENQLIDFCYNQRHMLPRPTQSDVIKAALETFLANQVAVSHA